MPVDRKFVNVKGVPSEGDDDDGFLLRDQVNGCWAGLGAANAAGAAAVGIMVRCGRAHRCSELLAAGGDYGGPEVL